MTDPIQIIIFSAWTRLLENIYDILLSGIIIICFIVYSLATILTLICCTFEDGLLLIFTNKRKYYKINNGELYTQQKLVANFTYIVLCTVFIKQSTEQYNELMQPFKEAVPVYY